MVTSLRAVVSALVLVLLAGRVEATTITLNPTARGCVNGTGALQCGGSGTPSGNFLIGEVGSTVVRDFFVFDLSSVVGPVISATFTFDLDANGYSSPDASEQVIFFDYLGSETALASGTGGSAAFADLGTGAIYFGRAYGAADNGTTITQSLQPVAITDLNASLGGLWAFGGAVTTLGNAGSEAVFAFSLGHVSRLTLETAGVAAVPEPASILLVGTGLVGAGLRRWRKRRVVS